MISQEQRFICSQQKELYEYAQEKLADIRKFSDDFMNSSFCSRSLDKPYSVDQFADIMNWLEFLRGDCEVEPDPSQQKPVPHDAAGWIGFVYRQLHFLTGLSSRELAALVPFDKLEIAYPGLHTLDEDMAADILIHDFHLPVPAEK